MTSEGLPTKWLSAEHREVLPTKWLVAQLAYDRIRRAFRNEGMSTEEAERKLHFAALQLTGKRFSELESDHLFALHLEQVIHGNAYPNY